MHFYGNVISSWGSIYRVEIAKDEMVEQVMLFRVTDVLGKKEHVIAWIQWKLLEE